MNLHEITLAIGVIDIQESGRDMRFVTFWYQGY